MTTTHGFYHECLARYGSSAMWRHCTDVFDCLCLCAIIGNEVLCVHGGLSPSLETIEQVDALERVQNVPHEGPMADLLWSKPNSDIQGWGVSALGAGYDFGADIADRWLYANGLELLIRGSLHADECFSYHFDFLLSINMPNQKFIGFPGAVATVDQSDLLHVTVIEPRPQLMRRFSNQWGATEWEYDDHAPRGAEYIPLHAPRDPDWRSTMRERVDREACRRGEAPFVAASPPPRALDTRRDRWRSFIESPFTTKVEFEKWDSLPDDLKAGALPGSKWQ